MIRNKLGPAAVGLVAMMFAGGVALAQQTPPPQQQETQQQDQQEQNENNKWNNQWNFKNVTDEQFAKMAAQGNLAEQKTGELAEQKSQNQAVKQFVERMEQDHSTANDKLKDAASQANVNLPTMQDQMQKQSYEQLSDLSGSQFDRAYARDQVKDHEKMIALFKHEKMDGKDQALKNYASETLPTLEEHLKLAQQMYHSVEGTNAATPGGTSH